MLKINARIFGEKAGISPVDNFYPICKPDAIVRTKPGDVQKSPVRES